MNLVKLEIVTPNKLLFSEDIRMLIVRAESGDLGILAGHSPLTATLAPGIARVIYENDEEKELVITGGFLEVTDNKITVLARTAEFPEDIDVARAESARQRAEEKLRSSEEIDRERAEAALERALARLRIAKKK